jgi:hypothetical protein
LNFDVKIWTPRSGAGRRNRPRSLKIWIRLRLILVSKIETQNAKNIRKPSIFGPILIVFSASSAALCMFDATNQGFGQHLHYSQGSFITLSHPSTICSLSVLIDHRFLPTNLE